MTPGRAEDEVGEELTLAQLPAALRTVVALRPSHNGKLFDDLNHQIHVYRWKDPNEEKCPAS